MLKKVRDLTEEGSMILWVYLTRHSEHTHEKVQVGKDQEKAQSEKESHSKNQGGKKPN